MKSIHIILDDSLNERTKLCLNNNFFDTKIKFNRKTKRIQKLILILILLILKGKLYSKLYKNISMRIYIIY